MTAKQTLAELLASECCAQTADGLVPEGKNLWVGLSDNQQKLVHDAVRLAVEEAVAERDKTISALRSQVKMLQRRGAWK